MSLTSALFTGLSGMTVNQTRLQVIGNNIANVNTVSFKSSRALFKPQFYSNDRGGSAPTETFGGSNPSQRGFGAQTSVIEKNLTPGTIEPTGKSTDMAIDGEGYFIAQGDTQYYTRDGSFVLNTAQELVTQDGKFLQGYAADENFNIQPGTLTKLSVPIGKMTIAKATTNATVNGSLNANGDVASGASVLLSREMIETGGVAPTDATLLSALEDAANPGSPLYAVGNELTIRARRGDGPTSQVLPPMTLEISATTTLADLRNFLQQGSAIDTTVAGPAGFTPGVTIQPGPTTGIQLQVIGNAGEVNALQLEGGAFEYTTGTTPLSFTVAPTNNPTGESVSTSTQVYDSLGTPVDLSLTYVLEGKSDAGTTWRWYASSADDSNTLSFDPLTDGPVVGTGTVSFDQKGQYLSSTGTTLNLQRSQTGSLTPLQFTLDMTSMRSLTDPGGRNEITISRNNGLAKGTLTNFSVSDTGTIVGSFTNGETRPLGQLALATFDNSRGLIDAGGNMFRTGPSSGLPGIAQPTQLGTGTVRSGVLEMSNVDLSKEFIDMIVTSTGFSASSRVISTSDQLMTELLNITR
jgi:flagellar hook protein FlgE